MQHDLVARQASDFRPGSSQKPQIHTMDAEWSLLMATKTITIEFRGGEIVTMSPGGPGKLISCLKCPQCGWSVTNGEDK